MGLLEALTGIKTVVEIIKNVKLLVPTEQAKRKIEVTLEDTESKPSFAEFASAEELGYPICRRHWPSQIMIDEDAPLITRMYWVCPACGAADRGFGGAGYRRIPSGSAESRYREME